MRPGIASDDDLAAGNTEVYADAEQIALLAARMLAFDDDAAGYDPVEKAFELLGACAYARRNRLRAVHVTKGDLERDLHSILLSVVARWYYKRRSPYPKVNETSGVQNVRRIQPGASCLISRKPHKPELARNCADRRVFRGCARYPSSGQAFTVLPNDREFKCNERLGGLAAH
jgi:hypothetical protein